MWLVRLDADLPGSMDPEVRADLIQRSTDLVATWPDASIWRGIGHWTIVSLVDTDDPHGLVSALPVARWCAVQIEPLVSLK